jgi:hypothetical protein
MARFFFHLVLPGGYQADDVGSEFPDIEAAWLGGRDAAIEMIADMLRGRCDPHGFQFEIADEQGHFLMELPFSEILRPAGRSTMRPGIGSQIWHHIRRNRALKDEIDVELAKSRSLLETTRATLRRSRAA